MAGASAPVEEALLKIEVGGTDVTRRFKPLVISVQVVDKLGETDECLIELDDSNGQLRVPADGESIKIAMGWAEVSMAYVFDGVVTDVESGFGRKAGGRRMWIEGKATSMTALGKQGVQGDWGEGKPPEGEGVPIPLAQVLQDAGGAAGYAVRIAPKFAAMMRKYWSQNESFFHFGTRLAKELGANFKLEGNTASFTDGLTGTNAEGEAMATVTAAWGKNLIAWRIKPLVGRPRYAKAVREFFDKDAGEWKLGEHLLDTAAPWGATAQHMIRFVGFDQEEAEQESEGATAESSRKRGTGWCIIDGEPQARAGGRVLIRGARPGVDGPYTIHEADHTWFRGGGYTTRLDVENPGAGVGLDDRPPGQDWL